MLKELFFLLLLGLNTSVVQANQSEMIMGYTVDSQGINYQVYSGGCTEKDDFEVLQLETFPVQLDLRRITPDLCRVYYPYGVTVQFTWEELGQPNGSKIVISNRALPIRVVR